MNLIIIVEILYHVCAQQYFCTWKLSLKNCFLSCHFNAVWKSFCLLILGNMGTDEDVTGLLQKRRPRYVTTASLETKETPLWDVWCSFKGWGQFQSVPCWLFPVLLQRWPDLHAQTHLKTESDVWLFVCVPWSVLLADINLVLETDTFQGRQGTIFLAFPIVRFSEINTDGVSWELVTYGWCDNRQRNQGQDSSFCTQMPLGRQIAALFLLIVSMWSLRW